MKLLTIVSRSLAVVALALIGIGAARHGSAADSHVALAERAVAMWTQPTANANFGDYGGEDGLANWQADNPADDLFAFGHVLHVPGRPDVVDSAGPRFLVAAYRAAFPDIVLTAATPTVAGDTVTVRWTLRGTALGTFAGLAPTGRPYKEAGSFVFRIGGGQIVETWVQARTAEALWQDGAGPLPESFPCAPPVPVAAPVDAGSTPDPSQDDPYYTGA